MKKAVIIGSGGQDGRLLWALLEEKGYIIIGIDIGHTYYADSMWKRDVNICDQRHVFELIKVTKPDEIYYLAAYHHSSEVILREDLSVFEKSYDVNVLGVVNFLEGIRKYSTGTRLFYAGSSHMFGAVNTPIQNEETPFNPNCIYGISKYAGTKMCHYYRKKYNLFSSVGILYNHESPLRPSRFVSRKIVEAAVKIKHGENVRLVLGDLETKVDWGYAGDYVSAMHKILQHTIPDDFIVSSGVMHKIKEFVEEVFDYLGLDWTNYVDIRPTVISERRKTNLFGDNRKIRVALGWRPFTHFRELCRLMVDKEMEQYEQG